MTNCRGSWVWVWVKVVSLLDAAQIDAKDSVLLAAELKAIEKGSSIAFGQGPSFQQKNARSHHQELARAVQLRKDIVSLIKWFPNLPQLWPSPTRCKENETAQQKEYE